MEAAGGQCQISLERYGACTAEVAGALGLTEAIGKAGRAVADAAGAVASRAAA